MQHLCVSDHGMMAAIPRQVRACEAMSLKPIFAVELYLQDKHVCKSEIEKMDETDKKELRKSYHLLAIAKTNEGYRNLVQLSSWAYLNGFYYKPRVTYEQLEKYKAGIIFTSCCYSGEIGQAFERGGEDAACAKLEQYIAMFGRENFFLEFMLLDFKKQRPYDAWIMKAHDKYGIPLIVTNDCHYCNEADSKFQRYMLMIQTKRTEKEILEAQSLLADTEGDMFELQDKNLWMKSEDELNAKWIERDDKGFSYSDIIPLELFEQAKRNTVEICKSIDVEVDRSVKLPQIPDADIKFREACIKGYKWRGLGRRPIYEKRLKMEFDLICRKGFSSYFMIQQEIIHEARRICPVLIGWGTGDEAIGPGRGCLAGDTEIVVSTGRTKPISEIVVGDRVITRDGTTQSVLEKYEYDVDEKLINIKCYYGDNKGVTLTGDHKVLVEKSTRPDKYDTWAEITQKSRGCLRPKNNKEWIPASQIEVGDWVFIPQPQSHPIEDYKIDLAEFAVGDGLSFDDEYVYQTWLNPLTKQVREIKRASRYVLLDTRWALLLGIFTGDGWLCKNKNTVVGFCFHSDDEYGRKCLTSLCEEYGFDFYVKNSSAKKLVQVSVKSRILFNYFKKMFNKYESTSQTKHVPDAVFGFTSELKMAFLRGYCMSDGCRGQHKMTYTTTSSALAAQIRYLSWEFKIPVSHNRFRRVDSRSGKILNGYTLNAPLNYSNEGVIDSVNYVFEVVEDGILLKVRSVSEVEGIKKVYDFKVENNSNYLTSSFLVHNSAVGSLVCYCLGITDVDPIKHGLLFDRFLSESRGGRSMKIRFSDIPVPV
jgi:intein/homing endonuclease